MSDRSGKKSSRNVKAKAKRRTQKSNSTSIDVHIGRKIRKVRLDLDFTQAYLAERVNRRGTIKLNQQRLSNIELGSGAAAAELFAIAWALMIDPKELDLDLRGNEMP